MPTLEGIVFIPLALYFFCFQPSLLFPLLIASSVFQASSLVSSGSFGLQPYYFIALLFVVRFLVNWNRASYRLVKSNLLIWLWLAFAVVSLISALVLPFVFQGIPVYDPRLGTDFNFISPGILRPQLANIVQPVFLILNVLVVITAARPGLSLE